MREVADRTLLIDVEYLGERGYIGCAVLEGDGGVALVDPGPAVSLPTLEHKLTESGRTLDDVEAVLLTHIHLDHAGATGSILRRSPRARVFVHERGARHLVDPEHLLDSAARLYGERMDELWGEFLPVPQESIGILVGGESLSVGGRKLEVAYTPGHASHHVSYFDTDNGLAFVGDTAGIRIDGDPFVLPVTPPPDVDLEAWTRSLDRIEAWQPAVLWVTHFGPGPDAATHLDEFRRRLSEWAERVRSCLESGRSDEECTERFTAAVERDIAAALPTRQGFLYRQGGAPDMSWQGLARYWRTKAANGAAS